MGEGVHMKNDEMGLQWQRGIGGWWTEVDTHVLCRRFPEPVGESGMGGKCGLILLDGARRYATITGLPCLLGYRPCNTKLPNAGFSFRHQTYCR